MAIGDPGIGTGSSPSLGLGFFGGNNPTALAGYGIGAGLGALLAPSAAPPVPYTSNLLGIASEEAAAAQQLGGQGQQLLAPMFTGKLPPMLEAQVDLTTNDLIAAMKSKYAGLNLGNSTMAADEAAYIG